MLAQALHAQYAAHRSWSYQLHYDNLVAWAEADRGLGRVPAYATVRRYMKSVGLVRRRKLGSEPTDGTRRADRRLDEREVRSYENEHVNGLWHLDFHHGKKKVLVARGEYVTPLVLGILDDHARLRVHHLELVLSRGRREPGARSHQAIHKRGPAALADDRPAARR